MRCTPLLVLLSALALAMPSADFALAQPSDTIELPEPDRTGSVTLERTLDERRSSRRYTDDALTLQQISQLLWAAQGRTHPQGYRTAPSAGALYPLEVYVTGGRVANLADGVYRYRPRDHVIIKTQDTDRRDDLADAALGQSWVRRGAIAIVFTAVYERTTQKYGDRGIRYVHMEVGHAAQNVYLQAEALDLGTVMVGAFQDRAVTEVLDLPDPERPLAILPVGRTAGR